MAYADTIRSKIWTADDVADLIEGIFASGFPAAWSSWSPSFGGFSSAPTGAICRYLQIGKMVWAVVCMPNNGTSNANTFTVSAPVNCVGTTNYIAVNMCYAVDAGTTTAGGEVYISAADPGNFGLKPAPNDSTWTTSGAKGAYFELFYEAA